MNTLYVCDRCGTYLASATHICTCYSPAGSVYHPPYGSGAYARYQEKFPPLWQVNERIAELERTDADHCQQIIKLQDQVKELEKKLGQVLYGTWGK